MFVENMEERLLRYEEYWNRENHDRPLLSIYAKKDQITPLDIARHDNEEQNWWETELIIQSARHSMGNTFYGGEAFPMLCPNLGPDVFAAFLGAELRYGRDTSWAVHFVKDWPAHQFKFDETNRYWQKIVELTQAFLDDSHGDYIVGLTDLHAGYDCLVSMRGPENVCMDLYDCPDQVIQAIAQIETAFQEVLQRSYGLLAGRQKGMTNWMGIYHPESWYVSSSDFIYLISPEIFDRFSADSIHNDVKAIGNTIFHLDGIGSLNHLDKLLAMPEINGIQWVYGDGKPTAAHWVDVLKKIQDAGKLIEITCVPSDMPVLFSSGLKPEGVHYTLSCENESQARQILADASEAYRKRVY